MGYGKKQSCNWSFADNKEMCMKLRFHCFHICTYVSTQTYMQTCWQNQWCYFGHQGQVLFHFGKKFAMAKIIHSEMDAF